MKYCMYCGAQMPSNGAFCGGCGRKAETAPQPTYRPMTQTQTTAGTYPTWSEPTQRREFVEKPEFLKTCSDPKVRKLGRIAQLVSLLSVLLIILGIFVGLGRNIDKLPIVKLAGIDYELERAFDEVRDTSDRELEEWVDEMRDEVGGNEADRMERAMKRIVKRQSLWNVTNYMLAMMDALDVNMNSGEAIFYVILVVGLPMIALLAFVLAAVFALLGGLHRNTGWSGAALVVSAFVMPLLSGVIITILAVASLVVQIILHKKVDREYLYALSGVKAD